MIFKNFVETPTLGRLAPTGVQNNTVGSDSTNCGSECL